MSNLILNAIQNTEPLSKPGNCACGDCSTFTKKAKCSSTEVNKGSRSCCVTCPEQPVCVKVDPTNCPTLNNIKGDNLGFTDKQDYEPNANPIKCQYTYDPDKQLLLKSHTDFTNYVNKYSKYNTGSTADDYYKPIMDYCLSDTSSNCFVDTFTSTFPSKCPIILTNTSDGSFCRLAYLKNMSDKSVQLMQSKMQTYCQNPNNIQSTACYCLAALIPNANQFSDIAQAVVDSNLPESGDPACWLAPCMAPQDKNLTSILLPKANVISPCPPPPCGDYAAFYNDSSWNNVNIKQIVVCDSSGNNVPGNIKNFLTLKIFGIPVYVWLLFIIFLIIFIVIISTNTKKK